MVGFTVSVSWKRGQVFIICTKTLGYPSLSALLTHTLAANAYKNHAHDPRRWTQTDLPNKKKVCFWLDMYRILTAPSINKPEAWFSDSGQAYSDFTEFNPSMKDYVAVVTTTLVILKFYFSMSNTAGSVSDPKRPTTRKKLTDRTKKQDHIISHRHSNDTV